MSQNHSIRLALWKKTQYRHKQDHIIENINRIVSDIDRRMYADYRVAEPSAKQRTRISGRLQSAGGE